MVNVIITFSPDVIKANDDIQEIDKQVKEQEKGIQRAKEDVVSIRQQVATALAVVTAAVGFIRLYSELTGDDIRSQFAAQIALATLTVATAVQIAALAGATGNIATFIIAGAVASGAASTIAAIKQAQAQTELAFAQAQQRELNLTEDF